jgi:hypothetical protein
MNISRIFPQASPMRLSPITAVREPELNNTTKPTTSSTQDQTEVFRRVFRITNVRANAAQFAGQSGSFQGQIPIP